MSKLNLKFTSKAIGEFEKKHGDKPILLILAEANTTIETLVDFVKCGRVGVDDDMAYEIIDEALAQEDTDTTDLMEEIVATIEKNGFFSQKKLMKALEAQNKANQTV